MKIGIISTFIVPISGSGPFGDLFVFPQRS